MYKAEIIADSVNPTGSRLTTFVITFPRIVLAEFNTHRVFSRNSASSRAIPFGRMLDQVDQNPFIPLRFLKDHKGMQGSEYYPFEEDVDDNSVTHEDCVKEWICSRDTIMGEARKLNLGMGITKQLCNRLLEPFLWHTVIVSATEWQNFFALRAHDAAEIHIQKIAYMMLDAYNAQTPKQVDFGEWHIPFGDLIDTERDDFKEEAAKVWAGNAEIETKLKIATARCARVSYLNFEGKDDYKADVALFDRLAEMGHWSPFEHCAMFYPQSLVSNFGPTWKQLRKSQEGENQTDLRVL